jgi:hypothetical protein
MEKIIRPRHSQDHPDRLIDCEEALEPLFQDLMGIAEANGWTPDEARRALRRLAVAHRRTETENAKVETELAIHRARVRAKR